MDFRRRLQYRNPVQYRSRWFDGLLMSGDIRDCLAGCAYGLGLALLTAAFLCPHC